LKAWMLVIGTLHSHKHSAEKLWFERKVLRMVKRMDGVELPELLAQVRGFLWIEDFFGESALMLWKDLRSGT
jgi:hypothetical protein